MKMKIRSNKRKIKKIVGTMLQANLKKINKRMMMMVGTKIETRDKVATGEEAEEVIEEEEIEEEAEEEVDIDNTEMMEMKIEEGY